MVPEQRKLEVIDPTGETWVIVRPPGWEEDKRRGELLRNRRYSYDERGFLVTEVDCNIRELWEAEIWLTYENTNLDVDIEQGGEVLKTITFDPRDETKFDEFMDKLGELPPFIIRAWRGAVVDIVRDWRNPF
jgi:hypothetical protein